MTNEQSGGSGRSVDDFSSFREGDIDPTLNKRITTLIDSNVSYLVYLDEDLYAEWTFNGGSPDGFASTANKIGHLETVSLAQLSPAPFGDLHLRVFTSDVRLCEGKSHLSVLRNSEH